MDWLIRTLRAGASGVIGWLAPSDQLACTVFWFVALLVLILVCSVAILYFPSFRSIFTRVSEKKSS